MRYKPGDNVLVKTNLREHDIYPVGVNRGMEKLSGSIQTIRDILQENNEDNKVKYLLFSSGSVWTGSFLLPCDKSMLKNY